MSSNVNCVEEQRMHGANAVRNTNREVERYYKRYSGIYHRSNSICYESSVCENRCYGESCDSKYDRNLSGAWSNKRSCVE